MAKFETILSSKAKLRLNAKSCLSSVTTAPGPTQEREQSRDERILSGPEDGGSGRRNGAHRISAGSPRVAITALLSLEHCESCASRCSSPYFSSGLAGQSQHVAESCSPDNLPRSPLCCHPPPAPDHSQGNDALRPGLARSDTSSLTSSPSRCRLRLPKSLLPAQGGQGIRQGEQGCPRG